MLDVHILTLPASRSAWLDQCIDSVRVGEDEEGKLERLSPEELERRYQELLSKLGERVPG